LTDQVAGRPLRWLNPVSQLSGPKAAALELPVGRRIDAAGRATPSDAPPGGPALAPDGEWPPAAQPPGHEPRSRRRLGRAFATLVVAQVLLIAAAIAIPIAARGPAPHRSPEDAVVARRQLADQINLQRADLPSTWTVDRAPNGPLSGFLGAGTSNAQPSQSDTHLAARVAAQFERCMGITSSSDRIFGPAGSTPSASSSSPAFAAPPGSSGEEAGSSVDVYASSEQVAADAAQIASAKFPACFGAALGTSFVGAATSGAIGEQVGQPQVQPTTVPQLRGVTSSGVDVTIPLTDQGTTVSVQFGVVLVVGGPVEATLFTFSEANGFPPVLTSSLSRMLADNIAAEGSGSAT
jgi:hypothetical protein